MFIGKQGALLAGASPLGMAPERKDDQVLTAEVKAALDKLGKDWESFKEKNDQDLAAVKKDVVTTEELERRSKGLDDAIAEVKTQLEEMAKKANRLAISGGSADAELKAAKEFGDLIGKKDVTPESLAEYKAALDIYLRREEKATTMSVASDPSGGYWVTPDARGRIVKKVYESTPMRQLANVVTIGTDALEGPIDNGEVEAAWIGESGTRSQTDTPQTGMWRIPVHELYAYPKVTQKLLEDAAIDVEAWLGNKASDKFSRKENAAFINGTGNNQPKGILQYTFAITADATRAWGTFEKVKSGANGAFAASSPADPILSLIFALKAAYRQNAKFLMSRSTMAGLRKLKDGQGNYLVDLRLRDNALVETIFGFANVDGEDMPSFDSSTGALGILFGDFNEGYTIVDRLGVSVIRDNITQPGFVKFNMRKRTGGGAVNFEAVKAMTFAA